MIQSLPFRPNPANCCAACVFGKGEHEDWCDYWDNFFDEDVDGELVMYITAEKPTYKGKERP